MSAEQVITRLGHFAPALRAMKGGLTISGGEVLVQMGVHGAHPARGQVHGPAHRDRDLRVFRRARDR